MSDDNKLHPIPKPRVINAISCRLRGDIDQFGVQHSIPTDQLRLMLDVIDAASAVVKSVDRGGGGLVDFMDAFRNLAVAVKKDLPVVPEPPKKCYLVLARTFQDAAEWARRHGLPPNPGPGSRWTYAASPQDVRGKCGLFVVRVAGWVHHPDADELRDIVYNRIASGALIEDHSAGESR